MIPGNVTKRIALFFILFFPLVLGADLNRIGIPFITTYSLEEYRGGMQNWALIQDDRGLLYAANNDGVLEFDGNTWTLIRMPNRSVVRSLAMDAQGTVYVGAVGEVGCLKPDGDGRLAYISLMDLIPEKNRQFGEVWETLATPQGILFRTNFCLYLYRDRRMTVIEREGKTQFHKSFLIDGRVYVREMGQGFFILEDGRLRPLPGTESLGSDLVISMLPLDGQRVLMATRSQGLFLFYPGRSSGPLIEKMPGAGEADRLLVQNILYCGARIDQRLLALGTLQKGVLIIDQDGRLVQHYHRANGLPDDTVYSMYTDAQKNLWLATSNGIAYLETGSPFSRLYARQNVFGNGFSAYLHKEGGDRGSQRLFLGTSRSVYTRDPRAWQESFQPLDAIQGQVWKLEKIQGTLLCGYSFGMAQIDPQTLAVKPILASTNNIHIFKFLTLAKHPDKVLGCGLYGFYLFAHERTGWRYLGMVENFSRSARYSEEDSDGTVWVCHENQGANRIRFSESLDRVVENRFFGTREGLPFIYGNRVYKLAGKVVFGTERGLYRFDDALQRFVPDLGLNRYFLKSGPLFPFSPDADGNIWFQEGRDKGLLQKQRDGSFTVERRAFSLIGWGRVEAAILPLDRENILFGMADGFVHYNPQVPKAYEVDYHAQIRQVELPRQKELLFGGTFVTADGRIVLEQPEERVPELPYHKNSLRFLFSSAYFERIPDIFYCSYLEGFDAAWTPWSKNTFREYTNLLPGRYVFHVRARNIFAKESSVSSFRFVILAPWYRTGGAFAGFGLAGILGILGIVRWRTKSLEREKGRLEDLVATRTQELKLKSDELKEMSLSDPLTNLRNRRYVSEVLGEEVAGFIKQKKHLLTHDARRRTAEQKSAFGILLCDIDHFKEVNDRYGHRAGDLFLKQLAGLLVGAVRSDDAVVRWGGEEFLVVVKKTDPQHLPEIAEKVRSIMAATEFEVGESEEPLRGKSCSIGMICFPFVESHPELMSFEQAIMVADKALYHAKQSGRNRTVWAVHAGAVPQAGEVQRLIQGLSLEKGDDFIQARVFSD